MQGILVSACGKTQRWCVAKGVNRYELEVEVVSKVAISIAGGLCWKDEHYLESRVESKVPSEVVDEFDRRFLSAP